jgi:penicillin-binding protein 1A
LLLAVVMRPADGAVLAMVGGRDYRATEWNNATQARRQPGSVAKLFVHLAAQERGASPTQTVSDAPLSVGGRPIRNFNGRYLGDIMVGSALARSSNTAAVRLAAGDTAAVRGVAQRLGITADLTRCEAGDLALGTWEARLIELVAAFAAVANGGFRVAPWCVQEVRGNDGAPVYTRAERPRERVMRAQHALEMRRMLAAVVRDGTGRTADPGFWAAGKTGTTSGHRGRVVRRLHRTSRSRRVARQHIGQHADERRVGRRPAGAGLASHHGGRRQDVIAAAR